jgi:hypothetical protein
MRKNVCRSPLCRFWLGRSDCIRGWCEKRAENGAGAADDDSPSFYPVCDSLQGRRVAPLTAHAVGQVYSNTAPIGCFWIGNNDQFMAEWSIAQKIPLAAERENLYPSRCVGDRSKE